MSGAWVSGLQVFVLAYFIVLSAALIIAFSYRRWRIREIDAGFEDLMRRRTSVYEMLKILSRESRELSARADEDLSTWLERGPMVSPEGQALRDVDTELEILQGELAELRPAEKLAPARQHLAKSVERTRAWIARVLASRTVGELRMSLASTADEQSKLELARANERIMQFARKHGIKEQDFFYHDSYFYV